MMLKLSVLLCLLAPAAGFFNCLGLRCFESYPPYGDTEQRPFSLVPTGCTATYSLLTRKNLDHREELCIMDQNLIGSPYFDCKKDTYVIIHGLWQNSQESWVEKMSQAILEADDVNCIIMDWGSCSWDPYMKAVQQTRMLGADLASFICALEKKYGCPPGTFHLIGVNFGANIAGYCGKLKKNIARIIGLSPTALGFNGDDRLHLNMSDACFVMAIHTDSKPYRELGSGFEKAIGDMDVFVNGGANMPECPPPRMTPEEVGCLFNPALGPMSCSMLPTPEQCTQILGNRTFTLADIKAYNYDFYCSHYQSINYVTDMFRNPQKYCGCQCDSVEDCKSGKTRPCSRATCTQLCHHAKLPACNSRQSKMYYVKARVVPVLP